MSEASDVAEIVTANQGPTSLDPDIYQVTQNLVPNGYTLKIDSLERFRDEPRRPRGDTVVHDAPSFIQLIQLRSEDTVVFADEGRRRFTGVFNYQDGWRDHTVNWGVPFSPEWKHWTSVNDRLLDQSVFAQHLEDGIPQIVSPPAADLLEIASKFTATKTITVESGRRVQNGDVQFTYHEESKEGAGAKGDVLIPTEFRLMLPVFNHGAAVQVVAKLRWRIGLDGLQIGYRLDNVEGLVREAFLVVANQISEAIVPGTGDVVVFGEAPGSIIPQA
jgi:uncharacterized protein YfdQ (DUF2303 family)